MRVTKRTYRYKVLLEIPNNSIPNRLRDVFSNVAVGDTVSSELLLAKTGGLDNSKRRHVQVDILSIKSFLHLVIFYR